MVDKKLFKFKYEKSETALTPPKTPVKRVPHKDIFVREDPPVDSPTPSTLTKIATGDFFEVFLNRSTGGRCLLDVGGTAVKKSLALVRNEVERKEVLREVEILRKIDSPYVIKYLRDWEVERHVFIEVEYCNLGTLRDLMDFVYYTQKSSFSKALVSKIMREISLGLSEIHRLSIVHLDLKPENIFLKGVSDTTLCQGVCHCPRPVSGDSFQIKIGDFNISRYEGEEMGMDGDKKYMAPEILDNTFSKASDVYSLGLIYLEILNGIILPTTGEGWLRLRQGIFTGMKLEGPARKMLHKDHKRRIETSLLPPYFRM